MQMLFACSLSILDFNKEYCILACQTLIFRV